jgi:hypothetical protein
MHDDDEKHEQRVAHRDEMTVRNFSIAAASYGENSCSALFIF